MREQKSLRDKLFPVLVIFAVLFSLYVNNSQKVSIESETTNVDAIFLEPKYSVTSTEANYYRDVDGYLVRPEEEGVYPGIIMIHEWWGLNDNTKQMAEKLASQGYVVLAVDLYEGEVAEDSDKARKLSGSVREDPERAIENMRSAIAYLKGEESVESIGSLGWCFGGQQSLQISLNENLDATVIYYGSLVTDKEELEDLENPVLGIFGSEDTSILVETVNEFEQALNELEVSNYIYVYEGVGHAFANPSGSNYAPEQTKDAWEKTVSFLDENLKG